MVSPLKFRVCRERTQFLSSSRVNDSSRGSNLRSSWSESQYRRARSRCTSTSCLVCAQCASHVLQQRGRGAHSAEYCASRRPPYRSPQNGNSCTTPELFCSRMPATVGLPMFLYVNFGWPLWVIPFER
eukprot:4932377-Prymnesium_polylepis.2